MAHNSGVFATRYPKLAGVIFLVLVFWIRCVVVSGMSDSDKTLWFLISCGLFVAFVIAAILPIAKLPPQP